MAGNALRCCAVQRAASSTMSDAVQDAPPIAVEHVSESRRGSGHGRRAPVVRVAGAPGEAAVQVVIDDDTLTPDWERAPARGSRPATGRMRDDLIAPEARLRPPRRRVIRRGPLGDDLIEPDWLALRPRGRVLRHVGPLGDDPLPPDWSRLPRTAIVLRTDYRPIGDDLLNTNWASLMPRAPRAGFGPMGDELFVPDDGHGADTLERTRGRRSAVGSFERIDGRAMERPAEESLEDHRVTLPLD
jgi:hypothetical protein